MTDTAAWRRAINAAVAKTRAESGVRYEPTDKVEVHITFLLTGRKLSILDVDNRLKDVFDSLQGFIGDKGKRKELEAIIPNAKSTASSLKSDCRRRLTVTQ